jgi:hypothetical protein
MSASNSTRTELRNLREVAHFVLPLICCEFCGKPLLDPKIADKVFGNKAHSPLKNLKLTVHHRNGKHRDNRQSKTIGYYLENIKCEKRNGMIVAICGNISLVHRSCHGEHEMKLNHHKRKVMNVKPLRERAKELLKLIFSVKGKPNSLSIYDWRFSTMIREIVTEKNRQLTRYEIRRLKKLAAKVRTE